MTASHLDPTPDSRQTRDTAVRILVVEHESDTGIERFGRWLCEGGAELVISRPSLPVDDPGRGAALPASSAELARDYRALVVLGGSAHPADDAANPYFPHLRHLLSASAGGQFPSFSICLGAEMLALAVGGEVRRRTRPNVGVVEVRRRREALDDPVFSTLSDVVPAIVWHQEEMTLPPAATYLMESDSAAVQAFRIGQAWGVQFHPEVHADQAQEWGSDIDLVQWCGKTLGEIVGEIAAAEDEVEQAMAPVARAFVRYAAGFGDPSRTGSAPSR